MLRMFTRKHYYIQIKQGGMHMKCPICGKNFAKKDFFIEHVSKIHKNDIPRNMTAEQYVYHSIHGTIKGKCMCGCGKETEWNYKTGKPYKLSNDPECKKRIREIALKNGSDGHLLKDMEHQKVMQKGREIAGVYTFKDGGKIDYLAKNELSFLRFSENVCEFTSRMVLNAPQVFSYDDNGTPRKYMPDYFMPDYNLLVEIKASNSNPEYMKDTGYKVKLKDQVMLDQKEYNFIKIVDNKFGGFLEILFDIVNSEKHQTDEKRVFIVTENVTLNNIIDEKNAALYLFIVKDRNMNIINIAISNTDDQRTIYFYDGKSVKACDNISTLFSDNMCTYALYRYIGEPEASDKLFQFILNNQLQNEVNLHPIMALLSLFKALNIKTPLEDESDFVKICD